MNILLITDELPPHVLGGSGRIAWETGGGLARLGHAVTILTAAPRGVFPNTMDGGVWIRVIDPLPLRWAHYRSVFSVHREREILRVIDEVRPNLIHAHGLAWQMGYRWIAPARKHGIACVATFHGVMHVHYGKMLGDESFPVWQDLKRARWTLNPLRNILARRMLRRCDALLSVSDALRMYLERHEYRGLRTLHNGIDMEFWAAGPVQEEARRMLALPADRTLFLLAGRLGHDKGLTVAMRSLPPGSVLLLAGEGDERLWQGLSERVRFFPKQDAAQMRLLYAAADATLVPSLYLDPFPTACLESMACGTPVVATCLGGSKEAIIDGETGWIMNPRVPEELGARLQWCCEHRADARGVGERARDHVMKNFSLEKHLERLLEVYRHAVHSQSS